MCADPGTMGMLAIRRLGSSHTQLKIRSLHPLLGPAGLYGRPPLPGFSRLWRGIATAITKGRATGPASKGNVNRPMGLSAECGVVGGTDSDLGGSAWGLGVGIGQLPP